MGMDQLGAMLGLVLGLAGGAWGWWYGRRQAAKQRGLDERYETLSNKALAMGWKITLAAIYVLFILVIFGIELTAAPVLGILLLVHMAGWTFSKVYFMLTH